MPSCRAGRPADALVERGPPVALVVGQLRHDLALHLIAQLLRLPQRVVVALLGEDQLGRVHLRVPAGFVGHALTQALVFVVHAPGQLVLGLSGDAM
jgi:hypothetical protein